MEFPFWSWMSLVSALLKLHGLKLGWHYSHYFTCPLFVESGERCSFPGEVHQRMCTAKQRQRLATAVTNQAPRHKFPTRGGIPWRVEVEILDDFCLQIICKHSFAEDVWARLNASLKDLKVLETNVLWELLPKSETRMTRNIMDHKWS